MKNKIILFAISILIPYMCMAQIFSGEYIAEWQWNMDNRTNWVNLLRLNMQLPIGENGSLEASTIHVAKTNERIIDDWQIFSNIEEENNYISIAALGYMHTWENAHLFAGIRNVNEDFFISDATSIFTSSSCGIFPTISASYPIANYPLSGLTVYFDVSLGNWLLRNSVYNGVGYNGWNRHDNPFLVHPRKDGVFDMAQLEYSFNGGRYFAGVAFHNRQFPPDEKGNETATKSSFKKISCAWWIYGEQPIWCTNNKIVYIMAQYSENTNYKNGCSRYGEIGCAYTDQWNRLGASGQYAEFFQGTEWSAEFTWNRTINKSMSIQPTFQFINNKNGNYTVLSARLYCKF